MDLRRQVPGLRKGPAVRGAQLRRLPLCRRGPCEVPFDDLGYVLWGDVGVPNVVREDEDDRAFVVAARAGVAQHRGRRDIQPLDLLSEALQEFAAALRAAAALPRRGAHEDLPQTRHGHMLAAASLSRGRRGWPKIPIPTPEVLDSRGADGPAKTSSVPRRRFLAPARRCGGPCRFPCRRPRRFRRRPGRRARRRRRG